MQHERSGLPDPSDQEETFSQAESERSLTALTGLFPQARATDMETYENGRLKIKWVSQGEKTYFLFTKNSNTRGK